MSSAAGRILATGLPYFNFAIGSFALSFQIGVLYPWHCQLDRDFLEMRRNIDVKLADYHRMKLEKLDTLQSILANQAAPATSSSQALATSDLPVSSP
ncbi:Uncharacterized protein PBTT_07548 [Plasmodiophora brassicae]